MLGGVTVLWVRAMLSLVKRPIGDVMGHEVC